MSDLPSVEEQTDPMSVFPEEWRLPVQGLLYLGQLNETVEFCGHTFSMKTLLPQDRFAIAIALQPYRNTLSEVEAFQAAHVAMALTAIDDDEDFCPPVGPNIDTFAKARLNWVSKNLYPPTLAFLWTRHSILEATAEKAIEELDRLQTGSQPITSPPWLDSLIAPGNSAEEIPSDTPPVTQPN